jgi:uncharacterized protein YceH (UPF0502 family)
MTGMLHLTPTESRALGVLIEKSTTTPEQYPLSINALTAGCNQKNNRNPVLNLSEDQVFDAVEQLREKQLVIRVDTAGSRVHKYKHMAGDVLRCRAGELAVLAELLMRGPQTLGELRGRASRMSPLATLDDVKVMLRALMEREEPLVRELPPAPGSRAELYAQLLSPESHAIPAVPAVPAGSAASEASAHMASSSPSAARGVALADRVTQLEQEVRTLRTAIQRLAAAVGEADPLLESPGNSPPAPQAASGG